MKLKFTCRSRIKNSVAQKTLSRLLAFGILINNIPINSFAGILPEDGRCETFAGNNITVNDMLEEDKTNIKIEGNSLVNLNTQPQATFWTNIESSEYNVQSDNYSKVTGIINSIQDNSYAYLRMGTLNINLFKPSTTYTVVFDKIEGAVSVGFQNDTGTVSIIESRSKITNNMITITTKTEFPDLTNETLYLYVQLLNRNIVTPSEFICENAMIFEGDLTNSPPTNYFEGIQSSFENNLITQEMVDNGQEEQENLGKYKVEYKVTGKNKAHNLENINVDVVIAKAELNKGMNYTFSTYNIPIGGGAIYICKDKPLDSTYINDNNIVQMVSYWGEGKNSWTSNVSGEYWFTIWRRDTYVASDSLIQIEEGSTVTEYEPYKESINTFYLNSPLLEGDTIEIINGQATHVKRYTEMTFDGSNDEDWINRTGSFPCENTSLFAYEIDNFTYDGNSLCDKFIKRDVAVEVEEDGFLISVNGDTFAIYIRINKGKLSVDSISGFKEWLKNNSTKVIYRLRTPIYEPIKADLSVQLFEGTTHISNNSNIPVNMEITVDRTLNRVVEAIELAKINPTIENLSKARMWVNLLDDSIKKDELQNEINNITNIEDLQLEKKSATANVDIYIKSENSLSMTLSTNSIMFEDYSGVSDIEKLNALEITVNSSLPYDLNAYLENEIQNSDKSTTMDSTLLQIKESSNLDYKTFNNTTDKVILEEDCPSGNYNKHNIDLKMEGSNAYKADVYKTVIKFEAEQK